MTQDGDSHTSSDRSDASERETLATPSAAEAGARALAAPPIIDRYTLLEKIGSGGMGDVWLADQLEPVRRRVAVKVIKTGMDTAQVIARFEAERQALALMDHPAIARVLDAGMTREGRPYFAMQVVSGEPITDYCDRNRLGTRERLELFMQVCEAVQHAHQKAVIHRDLKPSNVVVSVQEGHAAPKVIDFGLAKAMSQPLTEETPRTALGMLVGTPGYMSPEQADLTEHDIDTRTDVYSLGVILYEMLVGVLPHEWGRVRDAGWEGLRRLLTQEDAPRPSARLSSIDQQRALRAAGNRHTDVGSLRKLLAGDLDWITMKALAKEKERRYGSPAELAEDIRRHLRHEPVIAGPPGAAYRLRKFIMRHRVAVAAAVVLAVALAVAFVGVGFGLVRARQAEAQARREAETSARVSGFLTDVIGSVDPERMGRALVDDLKARSIEAARSRDVPSARAASLAASLDSALEGVNSTDAALHLLDKEVLEPASRTIDKELSHDPLLASRLQLTMGMTYRRLGLWERAESYARSAVELRRRTVGDRDPETLAAMSQLAVAVADMGRFEEAERIQRETLDARRAILGEDHPDTLASMHNLALAYQNQSRLQEAQDLYERALEARRRILGPEHLFTLRTMNNLANVYNARGKLEDGRRLIEQTLEIRRRVLGADHADTLAAQSNLAIAYLDAGLPEKAEPLLLASLESVRRVLGEDHPDTYRGWSLLGEFYLDENRGKEAAAIFEQVSSGLARTRGPEHPDTLFALQDLAQAYRLEKRFAEAEQCLDQVLGVRLRVQGEEHPNTLATLQELAEILIAAGQPDRARPLVSRRLEARRAAARRPGADPGVLNAYAMDLLMCEPADMRRPDEALAIALAAAQSAGNRDAAVLDTLALAYHRTGQTATAIATLKIALAVVPDGESYLRDQIEKNLKEYEAAAAARR